MNYILILAALGVGAFVVIVMAIRSTLKQRRIANGKSKANGDAQRTPIRSSNLADKHEKASRKAVQAMMTKYYEVVVVCTNCAQSTGMFLPRGTATKDVSCPKCSVKGYLAAVSLATLSATEIESLDIIYPEGLDTPVETNEAPSLETAKVSAGPGRKSPLFQ